MSRIRVLHFGLGPIGAAIAAQIAARPGFRIVGAIDVDPGKVGQDLGDLIGMKQRLGVRVRDDAASTLKAARPDVVVHCTGSSLKRVLPQLEGILKAKAAIVSTTEELAYPSRANKREATVLDALARKAKVAVLGTGVNPGFTMDALPIMLTAVCERVDRVSVHRVQDARIRRLPFQQKIGAGLTLDEFRQKVNSRAVRHVGFAQSIAMIADALSWKLDRISDEIAPKIADAAVESAWISVAPGRVCGIVQDGVGYRNGEAVIALHLEAYLGAPRTYDSVDIAGSPPLSITISTGVHGDIATASIVVNSIPKVLTASPGLHTMRTLALPSFFPGR